MRWRDSASLPKPTTRRSATCWSTATAQAISLPTKTGRKSWHWAKGEATVSSYWQSEKWATPQAGFPTLGRRLCANLTSPETRLTVARSFMHQPTAATTFPLTFLSISLFQKKWLSASVRRGATYRDAEALCHTMLSGGRLYGNMEEKHQSCHTERRYSRS